MLRNLLVTNNYSPWL